MFFFCLFCNKVILGTFGFLVISYFMLMYIVIGKDDLDIIIGIDQIYERILIGVICNVLMIMVFDMFYWKSCREKTGSVICCQEEEKPTWSGLRDTMDDQHRLRQESGIVIQSYDVKRNASAVDFQYHQL